jgi:hypothetical protein
MGGGDDTGRGDGAEFRGGEDWDGVEFCEGDGAGFCDGEGREDGDGAGFCDGEGGADGDGAGFCEGEGGGAADADGAGFCKGDVGAAAADGDNARGDGTDVSDIRKSSKSEIKTSFNRRAKKQSKVVEKIAEDGEVMGIQEQKGDSQ